MSIEERILRLSMDDSDFQRGADDAITKLEELKAALNFGDVSNSADIALAAFSGVGSTISTVSNAAVTGASTIASAFNEAWDLIYAGFMQTIGYGLANKITSLIDACTIEPVSEGWSKYEESIESVQKIMINTGYAIEDVEAKLNTLATYSDQTSYGYTDMSKALSTFVSAGQSLDSSVTTIIGLSNWCATAGVTASNASGAYDMFSKSVQAGFMSLQQWYSLQKTYNLGTTKFYETLKESAIAMNMMKENTDGTLSVWNAVKQEWDEDSYQSVAGAMQQTLKYQWLTDDLLFDVMGKYGTTTEKIMQTITDSEDGMMTVDDAVKQLGVDTESFGYKAMLSAQQAKTLTDTLNAWKDVVSTQWRGVFEDLFGNYEEAAEFWTKICDTIGAFFWDLPYAIHDVTSAWHDMDLMLNGEAMFGEGNYSNYKAFTDGILNVAKALLNLKYVAEDAFDNVFGSFTEESLGTITGYLAEFGYLLRYVWLSEENLASIGNIIEQLLQPIKVFIDLIGDLITAFAGVSVETQTWVDQWDKVHTEWTWLTALKPAFQEIGDVITYVADSISAFMYEFTEKKDFETGVTAYENLVSVLTDLWEIISNIVGVAGEGLMHILGLESVNDGNVFTSAIDAVSHALSYLCDVVRDLESPMDKLNGFFSQFEESLGLNTELKETSGYLDIAYRQVEKFGGSITDYLSPESGELLQTVFGGDSIEEAWNNATSKWEELVATQSDRKSAKFGLFDGKSFGAWLDESISEADVSTFERLMTRIKNIIDTLPDARTLLGGFFEGFKNATSEYGFNIPTSWNDVVDILEEFFGKMKELIDSYVAPLFEDIFGIEGYDTNEDPLTWAIGSIGGLVGVIVGAVSEWNTDRFADLPTIFESVKQLFQIVGELVQNVIWILGDAGIDTTFPDSAIDLIRTASDIVSGFIEAIATFIDSIATAMGLSDGMKAEQGVKDLGLFGEIANSLGTILGNLLPGLLEIVDTIILLTVDVAGSTADLSGTSFIDSALDKINQVLLWIGKLVVSMIDWTRNLLESGVEGTDFSNASSIIQEIVQFFISCIQPIVTFFEENDIGALVGTSSNSDALDTVGNRSSLLDTIFNLAVMLIDYTAALAGVITDRAIELAIKVIQNIGTLLTEVCYQFVSVMTAFSAIGGSGAITNLAAMISAINISSLGVSLTGVVTLIKEILKISAYGKTAKNIGSALLDVGKFLLIIIASIAFLGFLSTRYTSEFIAGCIATVAIMAVVGAGLLLFYKAYLKLSNTIEKVEKVDPAERIIDNILDKFQDLGLAGLLIGFAALFGTIIVGLAALTAVTALAPGGIGALVASALVVIGVIIAVFKGTIYLLDQIRYQANAIKSTSSMYEMMTAVGSLTLVAYAIGFLAVILTVLLAGLTALFMIVDKISGGQVAKYLAAAAVMMLLIGGLIALLFYGTIKLLNNIEKLLIKPNWETLAGIALVVTLVIALASIILGLFFAISALMVSLTVANNLKLSTMGKAGLMLVAFGLVVFLFVKYLTTSLDDTKNATMLAKKLKLPEWSSILKLGVIIAGFVIVYKVLMDTVTKLASIKTSDNFNVAILWNCVAAIAVIAVLAVYIAKWIMNLDNQISPLVKGESAEKGFNSTFYAVIMLMLGMLSFITLTMWITSKFAGKEVDSGLMWEIIAMIGLVSLIMAGLAVVAKSIKTKTSVAGLAVMLGGVALALLALVACVAILAGVKNFNADGLDAVWDILQIFLVIAAIAAVAGMLVAGFIPNIGEIAVGLGALLALSLGGTALLFAAAVWVVAEALETLASLPAGSIVGTMAEISQGLDAIFGTLSGWVGAIFLVCGAFALLQLCGGDVIKWLGIFVLAIAAIVIVISVLLMNMEGSFDENLNKIGTCIEAVASKIPDWFDSIISATEESLLRLVESVGAFSPELLEAFVFAFSNAFGGVTDLLDMYAEYKSLQDMEKYGSNDAIQTVAFRKTNQTLGWDEGDRNAMTDAQRAAYDKMYVQQYEELWDEYNQREAEGYKLLGYTYGKNNQTPIADIQKIADWSYIDTEGNNIVGIADYIAQWMSSNNAVWGATDSNGLANRRAIDEILDSSQLAYFAEAYPEYWQQILDETDYKLRHSEDTADKTDAYWKKYYGEVADGMVDGAEEVAEGANEAGSILSGIFDVETLKKQFGLDNIDVSGLLGNFDLSSLTSLFNLDNLNLGDSFSGWSSVLSGGEIDLQTLINFELVDENGNVLGTDENNQLTSLLSSSGLLSSGEGETVLTSQALVDVLLGGGTLNFNGTEIDMSNGIDLNSLIGGLLVTGSDEETAVTVPTTVNIEGNTIFNTEDIAGDAELLAGYATTYESTGQTLGAALLRGFYSYYSSFNTKAYSMAWNAVVGFRSAYSRAYQAGAYMSVGFILGMKSKAQAVYDAGVALGQKSASGYEDGGGVSSPSKKTFAAGVFMGEGAVNGMMSMANACYDAAYLLGEESANGYASGATVTPVIDTTAFQNGVGRINDTFAEATALNADYTVHVNGRAKSTKELLAAAFSDFNSSLGGISDRMNFGEKIDQLGEKIGQMGFYVDGKKFANAMAEHNDTALARSYVRRGRS